MKRWVSNLLLIVFAAVFFISSGLLIRYWLDSARHQGEFDRLALLAEQAQTLPDNEATDPTGPTEEVPPSHVTLTDPVTGLPRSVLVQYVELYKMNSDLVGWMRIDGTRINYPVMQTPDRTDFYLHKGFDKLYSSHGCLYVKEDCDVFAPSDNLTVYGHRMKDGSMFADLYRYTDPAFYTAHPTIIFDTLTEHHTYQILAVFTTTASVGEGFAYHMFVDAEDEAEFNEYISRCKALSLYDTGTQAQFGDKLITLSTCEYSQVNGRLVVVAKRLD